jgi:hypothetical protein
MRWLAVVGLLGLGACAGEDGDGERHARTAEPVQSGSAGAHYNVAVGLSGALREASRATGALLVPRLDANGERVTASDGTPIRSSCGVTFFDRIHAITAAHCADDVDVPDPTKTALTVQLLDVDNTADWRTASKLTGTFPAWDHATIDSGWTPTNLACRIVSRCKFGAFACPPQATAADADIMMLACDAGLPPDRTPVAIAPSDAERGAARVFWFHEIYDAPSSRPPSSDRVATDRFVHYATADETGMQNFHYFEGRNQLLPLVSSDWPGGVPRSRLRREGTVVWTDLFGCHGTSGSGVMQLDATSGSYQLLGPVATASSDWGAARLCTDLATHKKGRASLSYTANEFTRELASKI